MISSSPQTWLLVGVLAIFLVTESVARAWDEPPALNPFGKSPSDSPTPVRDDALPGYCELSDGTLLAGQIFLTRDVRLKVYDAKVQRQREVPLAVVRRIECLVDKEWREKEWRFKENANDEKVFTGRSYPAREYSYKITLADGRSISGPLSAIVYVQDEEAARPRKLLLHKRDKGEVNMDLATLLYVRRIELGAEAMAEARRRAKPSSATPSSERSTRSTTDKKVIPGAAGSRPAGL